MRLDVGNSSRGLDRQPLHLSAWLERARQDSKATDQGGYTLAHSAFVDLEYVDADPRESIEIKLFAFLPEESV
jgi:hypothetical protein